MSAKTSDDTTKNENDGFVLRNTGTELARAVFMRLFAGIQPQTRRGGNSNLPSVRGCKDEGRR